MPLWQCARNRTKAASGWACGCSSVVRESRAGLVRRISNMVGETASLSQALTMLRQLNRSPFVLEHLRTSFGYANRCDSAKEARHPLRSSPGMSRGSFPCARVALGSHSRRVGYSPALAGRRRFISSARPRQRNRAARSPAHRRPWLPSAASIACRRGRSGSCQQGRNNAPAHRRATAA